MSEQLTVTSEVMNGTWIPLYLVLSIYVCYYVYEFIHCLSVVTAGHRMGAGALPAPCCLGRGRGGETVTYNFSTSAVPFTFDQS